jgi:hypothetical protein
MAIRPTKWAGAAAFACVCSLSAAAASAATYVVKTSNPANQTFTTASGAQLVNLGEGNGSILRVPTVGPSTRLVILFNGEYSVAGPNHVDWLRVEILVDGVVAPPSGGFGHALCTSDGDNALDNWITAASDASLVVGPGVHAVQLRGQVQGGAATDWWLGDLSLIVIAQNQ